MLVIAPVIYLVVAYVIMQDASSQPQVGTDMVFYILLLVSFTTPAVVPVIERLQISLYRGNKASAMQPFNVLFTLLIIRMALVESVYVFGLAYYFLSFDYLRFLLFYAIGLVWTVIYWPTAERKQRILDRIGTKQ